MEHFFARHGLRRVINASGTETIYGASRCAPEIVRQVGEMLPAWVDIADLQRAASEAVALATGAEAGFITGCSAAGIAVSVAAAMAGADRFRAEQLPDTTGMKRKVLLQKGHEVSFGAPINQMIRLAGAEVVEIGTATACGLYQLEASLTDDVVAAVYVISHHTVQSGLIDLVAFCNACRARNVPVIVDAAAEYNWPAMIAAGPAAVIFSAQKAAAGPTAGIIAGTKDFIRACQMQERGIGRPMKAGKENVAGAIAALDLWRTADKAAIARAEQARLAEAERLLADIPGLRLEREPDPPGNPFERLMLHVDPRTAALDARQLGERLGEGEIKIVLRSLHTDRGYLLLDVRRIDADELNLVAAKVRAILSAARGQEG